MKNLIFSLVFLLSINSQASNVALGIKTPQSKDRCEDKVYQITEAVYGFIQEFNTYQTLIVQKQQEKHVTVTNTGEQVLNEDTYNADINTHKIASQVNMAIENIVALVKNESSPCFNPVIDSLVLWYRLDPYTRPALDAILNSIDTALSQEKSMTPDFKRESKGWNFLEGAFYGFMGMSAFNMGVGLWEYGFVQGVKRGLDLVRNRAMVGLRAFRHPIQASKLGLSKMEFLKKFIPRLRNLNVSRISFKAPKTESQARMKINLIKDQPMTAYRRPVNSKIAALRNGFSQNHIRNLSGFGILGIMENRWSEYKVGGVERFPSRSMDEMFRVALLEAHLGLCQISSQSDLYTNTESFKDNFESEEKAKDQLLDWGQQIRVILSDLSMIVEKRKDLVLRSDADGMLVKGLLWSYYQQKAFENYNQIAESHDEYWSSQDFLSSEELTQSVFSHLSEVELAEFYPSQTELEAALNTLNIRGVDKQAILEARENGDIYNKTNMDRVDSTLFLTYVKGRDIPTLRRTKPPGRASKCHFDMNDFQMSVLSAGEIQADLLQRLDVWVEELWPDDQSYENELDQDFLNELLEGLPQ